jgi:hypothetical protein
MRQGPSAGAGGANAEKRLVSGLGALGRHRSGVNSLALNRRGELLFSAGRYFVCNLCCGDLGAALARGPAASVAAPSGASVAMKEHSNPPGRVIAGGCSRSKWSKVLAAWPKWAVEDALHARRMRCLRSVFTLTCAGWCAPEMRRHDAGVRATRVLDASEPLTNTQTG